MFSRHLPPDVTRCRRRTCTRWTRDDRTTKHHDESYAQDPEGRIGNRWALLTAAAAVPTAYPLIYHERIGLQFTSYSRGSSMPYQPVRVGSTRWTSSTPRSFLAPLLAE